MWGAKHIMQCNTTMIQQVFQQSFNQYRGLRNVFSLCYTVKTSAKKNKQTKKPMNKQIER